MQQDVTQLIRDALYAQGFTPSSLGHTATFDRLVQIIFESRAVSGGSYSALTQEVQEAAQWAQSQGIYPLPAAYLTATQPDYVPIPREEPIIMYSNGGQSMASVLDALGVKNLTNQASLALSALAFVATSTGRRFLFASPALLARLGIPGAVILEGLDLLTPGTDIPSPSDIPQAIWELLRGTGSTLGDAGGELLGDVDELIIQALGGSVMRGSNGVYPAANPFAVGQVIQTNQIVKTWEANGIWFAKQADGKMLVFKTDGTIKSWKPKKPIVVYPSGRVNLDSFTDIAKYAIRTAKTVDKVLRVLRPRTRTRTVRSSSAGADGTNVTNVKN
jgi:hypothetical protein